MLSGLGVCVLGLAVIWNPFTHVSLDNATVVVPAAMQVTPPSGRDDVLVIVYSGDGGWADLDKQLGNAFAARGLPVLGVNTFKYYWRMRTADESAAQLDALMTKYLEQWHKQRVWLVGFSFGADVLPTIIDKLSPENRARIAQLVLLSPSRDFSFEIQFEGYMVSQGRFKAFVKRQLEKFNKVPHYPTLPPVQAMQRQLPVVCYYGTDDADESLCTIAGLPRWIQVYPENGGHHFDGGYAPLAARLIEQLPARVAPAVVPH
ncbi:MAG: AcvB/VirJ family lysyl-phosphatidylglycerol hydrolase [Rhodanobacter sp.]